MKAYMYDVGSTKVLIDGKGIDGYTHEGLSIDADGITTNFIIKSEFLKKMRGQNIKIIYMDNDVTAVTKMKIEKLEALPRTAGGDGMPQVPIKFHGTPKATYTD